MAIPETGQNLVKVPRQKRRKVEPEADKQREQRLRSLDEVAARYHTPHDVIPGEGDPERRHKPTISVIELTSDGGGDEGDDFDDELPRAPVQQSPDAPPDTSDGVLRTLEDLMARFPFDGSGQYYIYVKRLQPRALHNIQMYGQQLNIKHRITIDEFIDVYGGGEYDLIPYGPPRRGGQLDESNRPIPKALAKPIRLTIPWVGDYATPPNFDAVITSENQEEDFEMHPGHERSGFRNGRRQIETPASAKIHETTLTFEEKREERERQDRQSEQERIQRERDGAVHAVTNVADKTIDLLKEQLDKVTEELRASREKAPGFSLEGMAALASTMSPKSDPEELRRMREQHKEEISRLENVQKLATDAAKNRHDDEMQRLRAAEREELQRMQRKVEDIERDSTKKVTDAETRARTDVERARDDARKDLERAEKDYNRSIEAARRDHERELNNLRASFDLSLQTERGSYERERTMMKELSTSRVDTEKSVLSGEIRTLNLELERLKLELTATKKELEQKGSLVKQIGEFNRVAEQMGFEKPEAKGGGDEAEPMDWKAMIANGGVELIKNLPQVLSAAAQALQARGQPQQQVRVQQQQYQPPPPRQMAPAMPQGQPNMAWQTEDTMSPMPLPENMQPRSAVPTMPTTPPSAGFEQADYQQQYQPVTAPEQQQMMPPPMNPATPTQPPPVNERRRRRAAQQPAHQPAPQAAPAPAPEAPQLDDESIRQIQPQLEGAFASGQSPAQVAQAIQQGFGAAGVNMGAQVSAEQVTAALLRIGQGGSPLARREGQKFVRGLQAELIKIRDSQGVSS